MRNVNWRKHKLYALLVIAGLGLLALLACGRGDMAVEQVGPLGLGTVDAGALARLAEKRIFFGHQSVGRNIVEGIKALVVLDPRVRLSIAETSETAGMIGPGFAHAKVGKNRDASSKLKAFARYVEASNGSLDIAFFKFCYVDVVESTDIESLFILYRERMEELRRRFPAVIFVHFTIPVTSLHSGPQAILKRILGSDIGEKNNVARERYNEKIRQEYAGKEPIFDLAAIEATSEAGARYRSQKDGAFFYSLRREYTSDGGHLNDKGRTLIAGSLLRFLAELPQPPNRQ